MCQCVPSLCKSILCFSLEHTNALNESDSGSPSPAFFPKQWGQGGCIFHRVQSIICGTSRAPGLFFPRGNYSLRSTNTWWETNAISIIPAQDKGLRGPSPGGKDENRMFPTVEFRIHSGNAILQKEKPWKCCLTLFLPAFPSMMFVPVHTLCMPGKQELGKGHKQGAQLR